MLGTGARYILGSITKVSTDTPVVALTFDDGPDPDSTLPLLELLENNQAKGTFFTVGESAERYPHLIQRMVAGGHAIGSHSWDHSAFPLLMGRERRRQLRACERVLGRCGEKLFRPPYGEQTVASRLDAWLMGYEVVCWSVTSEDWYEPDAGIMTDLLVKRIRPGDVVLLHDCIFDKGKPTRGPKPDRTSWVNRASMLKALELMFERIGRDFHFVTVPELLRHGKPYRSFWFKQTSEPGGLRKADLF
jgi:peptidoglycan/xylan/chitin deacetylase (PgdA/CDA1 family)